MRLINELIEWKEDEIESVWPRNRKIKVREAVPYQSLNRMIISFADTALDQLPLIVSKNSNFINHHYHVCVCEMQRWSIEGLSGWVNARNTHNHYYS